MAKKGEVFWDVGRQMPKEIWDKVWSRGEFVESPKFTMPGICTLQIFFYPGGMGDSDHPKFKLVRSDTTLRSRKIQGEIQLLYDGKLQVRYFLGDKETFERGNTDYVHGFTRFQDFHKLKIFYPLPKLGYRWEYTVFDPDPNETEPEPLPEPDIITNAIGFVWSGINSAWSYVLREG